MPRVESGWDQAGVWPKRPPCAAVTSSSAAGHHSQSAAALLHPACSTQGVPAEYQEGQSLRDHSQIHFLKRQIVLQKLSFFFSFFLLNSFSYFVINYWFPFILDKIVLQWLNTYLKKHLNIVLWYIWKCGLQSDGLQVVFPCGGWNSTVWKKKNNQIICWTLPIYISATICLINVGHHKALNAWVFQQHMNTSPKTAV